MSALACLRVMVRSDQSAHSEAALGLLVAKFTTAFLEVRWSWPRKFSAINPYAFLLNDPRASELDTAELGRLSAELHAHLFGDGEDEGSDVTVLLFEGPDAAMAAFADLSEAQLARAMVDPAAAPAGGRLSRITLDGRRLPLPPSDDEDPAAANRPVPSASSAPLRNPNVEAVQGVYYSARQIFVADVIASTPADARTHFSLVDGNDHLPADPSAFDADCVIAAFRFLAESPSDAPLYLPVSFSTVLRPSRRAAYAELLAILPASERRRLAAAVYDVPRAPSFQALKQLHDALDDRFSAIDLRTHDPGFEIEQLGSAAVTSVTLVLPQAEPEWRLIVLRRFISRMEAYKRRRIWPGVTNIRSRRELDVALEARVPFLTGPGICRRQGQPLGGRPWGLDQLPVMPNLAGQPLQFA
ncbi:hypothetical protein [Phenylobacterium sp.]|uniref:hypothetical protein n=1 Tax=Phenylobacterium sp. TaxID=1871053 RepID=UPI00272FBEDA|nr:hypothetical protein [Phenylobacterium sp.]MDP1874135.1 hypothetical protein [Phenylobacterium sp.]MDP3489605.1 hypothetical protein [Phenylobacterium sp.]